MKLKDILAKIAKGEALNDEEKKFVGEYDEQTTLDAAAANARKKAEAEAAKWKAKAEKAPLNARDSITLAQSYHSIGQDSQSVQTVRKTLALPDAEEDFDVLYLAGHLLSACGQRGDAANAMKRAVARMPANLDPRYRLEAVNILSEGGLTAEAETTLNTYLRDQPNDVEAWLKMAILKDARGQVEQAQSAIIQAYKIDRNAFAQLVSANEQLQRIAAPLFQKR